MAFPIIEVDGIPSVNNALDILVKGQKQLPFAISLALNKTGDKVIEHAQNVLFPSKFTLRNQWHKKGPFRVKKTFANKGKLETVVGSEAPWLKDQEEGGTRKAKKTIRAIPEAGIRQTEKRLVKKQERPGALISRKKAFFLRTASGPILFTRTGDQPRDLKAWYFGKPSVTVRPTLGYVEAESRVVEEVYPQMFGEAFAFALATEKKGL